MLFKLFLLFTAIPIIELVIFIKIGAYLGFLNTLALIIITALVGSYMVKMEGLNVYYRFQENIAQGVFPAEELLDGILILVAGALLITPGILTDMIGFLLISPVSKDIFRKWIKTYIKKKMGPNIIDVTFRDL